jgi:hypothetical protein
MSLNPNTYFAPALTDVQSELTSKIGSMKSILALPNFKKPNIPKDLQISPMDYLLKVLSSLGIDPQVIFSAFLSSILDEATTKLEDFVVKAIADAVGQKGITLNPYENATGATDTQIKVYKEENFKYLKTVIPETFLQTAKQKLIKDLMIMIFGPKDGPVAEALNPVAAEREYLISNAVCGIGMFAISNDPQLKDSDIEYTRIKKRQELENGQVIYEISCQDVKITLPENPTIFFQGGGVNSVGQNLPLTPYQSIVQINQYVVNQSQKINSEKNSNKVGKSFLQTIVESLISAISTLVQPYLPEVFATISSAVTTENNLPSNSVSFPTIDFVSSMCEINNLPSSGATETEKKQKKEFVRSLLNSLLKDLIKLLLAYAIKRFKKFVKEYFAKKAKERQKRKMEKNKLKYEQNLAKINKAKAQAKETQEKIQKYQAAINVLTDLLGAV